MTYFTQPTCKILEEKGVVSESGMWWCSDDDKNYILTNDTRKIVGDFPPDIEDYIYTYQAYTLLDIFNPDNAKKLFGDEEVLSTIGMECVDVPMYSACCHQLLNTMLSGGDVEAELIKLLK